MLKDVDREGGEVLRNQVLVEEITVLKDDILIEGSTCQ